MADMDAQITVEPCVHATDVLALLELLPEWFGRPASSAAYALEAESLEAVTARQAGALVGLATLKAATDATCELAVMAVHPGYHRRGLGRRIIDTAVARMKRKGFRLALVQTVGTAEPDPAYAMTRKFYASVGFVPVIEIADHFGPGTPALLMVMPLQPVSGDDA